MMKKTVFVVIPRQYDTIHVRPVHEIVVTRRRTL
jgi:hypothetical protein